MKILSSIFPINLYLNIFQLEGYDVVRFLKWVFKNYSVRNIPQKRSLVYTVKTKLLLALSLTINLLIFLALTWIIGFWTSLIVALLILTQSYILLTISRLILYPFELLVIQNNISKTNKKIKSLKNLKVIAITGSYGKTSVKEILYQLIKDDFKTLRTPESYNTTLGIAKVVNYELDSSYKYFICEMAAYHNGDIYKLCKMVPPNYGILTGITSQHLERFGSFKDIVKTKFELYESVKNKDNFIFNLNNKNIKEEADRRNILNSKGYLKSSNLFFSQSGSEFDFYVGEKKYYAKTNLFGKSNIENLTGAMAAALKLDVKIDRIVEKIGNLTPVASRFVLKNKNNATIVDNTFSSNDESFKEMVETAKMVKGSKVLITPGLVELGEKESEINYSVGKLVDGIFDNIILVGDNNRTRSFAKGLKTKAEIISDTRKDYFAKIEELSNKYDWIFLENDVTENY